jgi:hypothetical protein
MWLPRRAAICFNRRFPVGGSTFSRQSRRQRVSLHGVLRTVLVTLLSQLNRTAQTVETSVQDLSRALTQCAQNYTRTEQSNTACYAPGFGG